jgi:hypothetical protein
MNEILLLASGIVFLRKGAKTIPRKIAPPTHIEEKTR